jgi:hypothetical protein
MLRSDEHLERPLQGQRRALKLNRDTVIDLEELKIAHQASFEAGLES